MKRYLTTFAALLMLTASASAATFWQGSAESTSVYTIFDGTEYYHGRTSWDWIVEETDLGLELLRLNVREIEGGESLLLQGPVHAFTAAADYAGPLAEGELSIEGTSFLSLFEAPYGEPFQTIYTCNDGLGRSHLELNGLEFEIDGSDLLLTVTGGHSRAVFNVGRGDEYLSPAPLETRLAAVQEPSGLDLDYVCTVPEPSGIQIGLVALSWVALVIVCRRLWKEEPAKK